MAKQETKISEETDIDNKAEANNIIRKRVYASVGAGFVPVPIFDVLALSGIQIEMVSRLAKLYEIPFRKDIVKTTITALVGGIVPVAATPLAASLFKVIPVIGYTTSAVTLSAAGGATTYAIGKVFAQHFESGGTLLNFNAEKVQEYYQEKFKEGEKVAAGAKAK
ncbi:MAG: DUF697 domain-containing protein [Deltaproteobacteria bacterium]|nr:DUF697 domain-containing protein [Deltaproteobacteria bacterium]